MSLRPAAGRMEFRSIASANVVDDPQASGGKDSTLASHVRRNSVSSKTRTLEAMGSHGAIEDSAAAAGYFPDRCGAACRHYRPHKPFAVQSDAMVIHGAMRRGGQAPGTVAAQYR
jgi:hypothetical protein